MEQARTSIQEANSTLLNPHSAHKRTPLKPLKGCTASVSARLLELTSRSMAEYAALEAKYRIEDRNLEECMFESGNRLDIEESPNEEVESSDRGRSPKRLFSTIGRTSMPVSRGSRSATQNRVVSM